MEVENHPLEPFLPANGKVLFLGSFPPPKARWSMDFFYPNWINDFWRIQGLIHFGDAHFFEDGKRFDRSRIVDFCASEGLAFFDTASKVRRLKGNASDAFLEIVEPSDVLGMLSAMPQCSTVVTTGGKASEELLSILQGLGLMSIDTPPVGGFVDFALECGAFARRVRWWRMPSSSRAFPMPLGKKAEHYAKVSGSVEESSLG